MSAKVTVVATKLAIDILIAVRVCSVLVRCANYNSFALLAGYIRLLEDYTRLSYYLGRRVFRPDYC